MEAVPPGAASLRSRLSVELTKLLPPGCRMTALNLALRFGAGGVGPHAGSASQGFCTSLEKNAMFITLLAVDWAHSWYDCFQTLFSETRSPGAKTMRRFILGTCVALAALLAVGRSADATAQSDRGEPAPAAAAAAEQTMYVTIAGPREVTTGWSCTWEVYVSGGTAPYTYHWSTMGMIENWSSGSTWNGYAAHGGNVGLDVLVTDANNQSKWGTLIIDSNNYAGFCMQ